jgi:hypothetical protein
MRTFESLPVVGKGTEPHLPVKTRLMGRHPRRSPRHVSGLVFEFKRQPLAGRIHLRILVLVIGGARVEHVLVMDLVTLDVSNTFATHIRC